MRGHNISGCILGSPYFGKPPYCHVGCLSFPSPGGSCKASAKRAAAAAAAGGAEGVLRHAPLGFRVYSPLK